MAPPAAGTPEAHGARGGVLVVACVSAITGM